MNTPPLPSSATHAKIFEFVRAMLGTDRGREDDDHPLPPGPWDPVIRAALGSLGMHAIGDGPLHIDALGGEVALNPQPLPPRQAFLVALARTLVARAELLQEITGAMARMGEQQGEIIVYGYVSRLCDEFCGTGFRLRWPFPGPRPHWFARELDGIDLVVMATQFDDAARQRFEGGLRASLHEAGVKFVDAGLTRLG